MPNWCSSNMKIKSSEENIRTLTKEFEIAMSSNPLNADFENTWLGNLLLRIGMEEDQVIHGPRKCRGSIVWFSAEKDTIELDIESAWSPHLQCVLDFCDYYIDDYEVMYVAEEPGCELYWTNDPEWEGKYIVDVCNDGTLPEDIANLEGYDNEYTAEELEQTLSEILRKDEDLDELIKDIEKLVDDLDSDSFLSIHQYEYVPIEDCD